MTDLPSQSIVINVPQMTHDLHEISSALRLSIIATSGASMVKVFRSPDDLIFLPVHAVSNGDTLASAKTLVE
jgi:hypothetical protein